MQQLQGRPGPTWPCLDVREVRAPEGRVALAADMLGKGPIVLYTFIQAFTGT